MNSTPPNPDDRFDDDQLLEQVRAALTPMPDVDRRAIANILTAVSERRQTPWQRARNYAWYSVDQFRFATSPLTRAAAVAAVFVVIGFSARGLWSPTAAGDTSAPSVAVTPSLTDSGITTQDPSLIAVEGTADPSSRLVSVQFVLDAREVPDARSISVVGDFNDWDVAATPLTLTRGAWSVSLSTTQGRHVYAFVINGERWIADPRAPKAADADFGRPGSVIIVPTP